ncbi:hypothetical protein ACFX13_023434 [Malus domestica]
MTDEACTEAGAAEGRRRVKQEAAHGGDFSKDVGLHCGVGLGLVDDFDGDGGGVDEGLDGGGQGSCGGDLAIAVAIEAFEDLSGLLGDEAALVDASRHVPSKPPGNRPEARPQGSPEVCSGDRRKVARESRSRAERLTSSEKFGRGRWDSVSSGTDRPESSVALGPVGHLLHELLLPLHVVLILRRANQIQRLHQKQSAHQKMDAVHGSLVGVAEVDPEAHKHQIREKKKKKDRTDESYQIKLEPDQNSSKAQHFSDGEEKQSGRNLSYGGLLCFRPMLMKTMKKKRKEVEELGLDLGSVVVDQGSVVVVLNLLIGA